MSVDIAFQDACETASRIAAKDVSAIEVTETAIRRAERLKHNLNAFISLEAEAALDEAHAVDARISKASAMFGKMKPLIFKNKELDGVKKTALG